MVRGKSATPLASLHSVSWKQHFPWDCAQARVFRPESSMSSSLLPLLLRSRSLVPQPSLSFCPPLFVLPLAARSLSSSPARSPGHPLFGTITTFTSPLSSSTYPPADVLTAAGNATVPKWKIYSQFLDFPKLWTQGKGTKVLGTITCPCAHSDGKLLSATEVREPACLQSALHWRMPSQVKLFAPRSAKPAHALHTCASARLTTAWTLLFVRLAG